MATVRRFVLVLLCCILFGSIIAQAAPLPQRGIPDSAIHTIPPDILPPDSVITGRETPVVHNSESGIPSIVDRNMAMNGSLPLQSSEGMIPFHMGSIEHLNSSALMSYPYDVFVSGNYAYIVSPTDNALQIVDISDPAWPAVNKGNIVNGEGGALLDHPDSVYVSGNYAYVASTGSDALEVVDVSNHARPVHAGSIKNGDGGALLHGPQHVFVAGNYAYLACTTGHALEIVDVSDPTRPVHAGSIGDGEGGALLTYPMSVYVDGNYAYVVSYDSNALEIIDVSNPTAPVHAGSIVNGTGGAILKYPTSLDISGNYAYVVSDSYYGNALEIIDISNPTAPVHAGCIVNGTGGALLKRTRGVQVSGNYAYVTSGDLDVLEILNVSNPAAPVHVGSIKNGDGGARLVGPKSVYISGDYAYVTSTSRNSLEIVNVSNPAAPVHTGSIAHEEGGVQMEMPRSVCVSGNYAYVVGIPSRQLNIFDVSDPAVPVFTGSLANGQGGAELSSPQRVCVSGNYAYVSGYYNGLEIVNVSNPARPVHTATILDYDLSFAYVSGNYAYVAYGTSLRIYNISNPAAPVLTGSISHGQGGAKMYYPSTIYVEGDYAYVGVANDIGGGDDTTYPNCLEIVNVSNPAAPVHAGIIVNGTGGAILKHPSSVYVSGNYAYVTSYEGYALEIVNVSNPAAPVHAGSIRDGKGGAFLARPMSVHLSGDYAYVASYINNALEVVDVSDPTAPVHKACIWDNDGSGALLSGPYDLDVSGKYAYVASYDDNALEIIGFGAVPSITSISPSTGSNTGDRVVAIRGNSFLDGVVVNLTSSVFSIPGSIIDYDKKNIRCTFPLSGAPIGKYNLNIRNPDGSSVTAPNAFTVTYLTPAITGFFPLGGWASTSQPVTINGTGFRTGVRAFLENGSTTIEGAVTSRTLTQIKCIFPLTVLGKYNITVLNSDSSSATDDQGFYIWEGYIPPSIANITPASGVNTAALPVTIRGAKFWSDGPVTITNGSTNRTVTGKQTGYNTLKCTLPLTGLPTGLYNITYLRTYDGKSVTLENAFTVNNPFPVITAISPASGYNSGSTTITITGSKFFTGANISLVNGNTWFPGTITSFASTKIVGTFILTGVTPRNYNLTVTNPDGPNSIKSFTVLATGTDPGITNFTPTSGVNTAVLPFTINGLNFRTGATVSITNGTINKTVSATLTGTTTIKCTLPLTGMPIGQYNLTVRNIDGSNVTEENVFTITNPIPAITSVAPISGHTTGPSTVTITGSKFVTGANISLVNGGTSIPGTITSFTTTKIVGIFALSGVSPGSYNLTVTNPGGPNGTKPFTVLSPGTGPTITSFCPVSGINTAALPLTITGTNYRAGATVTITNGTTNKTVSGTLTGTTTIKCSLPLGGLPIGLYNLTVRNTDGSNMTQENVLSVNNPAPVITTIAPASGYTIGSTLVTVTGSKFVTGAEISLVNTTTGIPGSITSFTATKIIGTFALPGVTPGSYNLTVTNPGGPNATKPFIVLSPGSDPLITNLTPNSGVNTAAVPVTVTGINFRTGATVTIMNGTTNKTVSGTVTGGNTIKCSLPLTGLPIGLYNLTVRNTDGSSVTKENTLTVTNPIPAITSISPTSGYNTSSSAVTISGSKFVTGAEISMVKGGTVITGSITSFAPTKIIGKFALSGATPGSYNLTVTNPGGPNTTKPFTVLPPGTGPDITSFFPTSGVNTVALPITITGLNFRTGATVIITNGTTNKTVTGTLTGTTKITCTLPLTGLPYGQYNVTVRNTDGSFVTEENGFMVTNPVPTITSMTPISGYNISSVPVTIAGTKFLSGAGIFLINESISITGTVVSLSATSITGSFLLNGTPAGIYNLTVSNPGNSNGTKSNAFTVYGSSGIAPVISSVYPVSGFNNVSVPVTITGSNFGRTVAYLNQGSLWKPGTATSGKTSTTTILYVTFSLSGIPGGLYNITVNSDGFNTTALDIFYVTDIAWVSSVQKTVGRSPVVQRPGVSKILNIPYDGFNPKNRQVIRGGVVPVAER